MSKNYLKRSYKKKRFVFKALSQFQFSVFNNFSSQKFWDRGMCPLSFPPDTATALKRNKLQPPLTSTSNCLFRRPSLKANSSCLIVTIQHTNTHTHTCIYIYIYIYKYIYIYYMYNIYIYIYIYIYNKIK